MKELKYLIPLLLIIFIISNVNAKDKLTLKDAIKLAIENYPTIKIQMEKQREYESNWKYTKTLLYPILTINGRYIRLDEKTTMKIEMGPPIPIKFEMNLTDDDLFHYDLQLIQPVYTGGLLKNLVRQAKQNIELQKIEKTKEKENIIYNVISLYYKVLLAQQATEVMAENYKLVQEHIKRIKSLLEAGVISKVDLLKAEVEEANAKSALISAQNNEKLAKAMLNNYIGINLNKEYEYEDLLKEEKQSIMEEEKAIETAYKNRLELKQLEQLKKLNYFNKKIVKSKNLPNLYFLTSYYGDKGTTPQNEWQNHWNAMLTLSWRPYDWGAVKAQLNQIKSALKEIDYQEQLLKKAVKLELKNHFLKLQEAEKNIEVSKKSIEQAKENYRIITSMYEQGSATNTEVLDGMNLISRAKMQYYKAVYEYKMAVLDIKKSMGKLIEYVEEAN